MALSETMSSPTEWLQYYQQSSFSEQVANPEQASSGAVPGSGGVAEATAVATTAVVGAIPSSSVGSGSNNNQNHLNPEGRVSKPIRRRSRASRRTPTTLLNTDTTNFRAMVQQFTGGPSVPFGSGSAAPGGPVSISFGLSSGQSHMGGLGGFMVHHPSASSGSFQLQYPMQQQQQPQNHPQYMLSLNTTSPAPAGDGFLQRLGNIHINPRGSNNSNMQGVLGSDHLDGVSSGLQVPPRPSSSPHENSFIFQ